MEHDDLEDRLRRFGRQPIAPDVEQAHLRAVHDAVPAGERRWRFGWRAVAAAGVVGFLAGSTGLAAAGNLPAPAQDAAHDVLAAIGVDVPRSTDGCPEGTAYRNHGEYVSAVEAAGGDVEAAAHAECGKPVASQGRGGRGGRGADDADGPGRSGSSTAATDGDPCTGPPPWAGGRMDRAQREAARAERQATCGTDDADEVEPQTPPVDPTTTTTTGAG